jgi:hypothetical protein
MLFSMDAELVPNKPRLTIRMSDADLDELRALAKRARLTVSELIRQWIRLGELPVRERDVPREEDWEKKT